MTDSRNWSEVVQRLAEKTVSGEVSWKECPRAQREDAVGDVYEASILGHQIACYEYRYLDYATSGDPEPATGVAVEFINPTTKELQWRLPETPHHYDLLDKIRYCRSGAAGFLDAFLAGSGS